MDMWYSLTFLLTMQNLDKGLTNLWFTYLSTVAINLHLFPCHTNKQPLQLGHCLSYPTLVQSTCSKGQHILSRIGNGKKKHEKRILKSPRLFVSSVIIDCDKVALSYLKPTRGQMVCPRRKGGNGFLHQCRSAPRQTLVEFCQFTGLCSIEVAAAWGRCSLWMQKWSTKIVMTTAKVRPELLKCDSPISK